MPRLLIVDDEVVILNQLEARLKRAGYEIVGAATDGAQAVQLALKTRPDLIIMDIMMSSEFDGIKAAKIISESTGIPIIFLTAHSENSYIQKVKEVNPYGYILKPLVEPELLVSIEIALYKAEMDRKLQASEEQYRSLTENLNIGIYRTTIESQGKLLAVNPAFVEIFGYDSKEELLERPVIDFYQDANDRKTLLRKLLQNGFLKNEEVALKKKDGTTFPGSLSISIVSDDNGKVAHLDGVVEDITERKQVEEALRESEERFRQIVERSSEAFYRQNIKTAEFEYVSPKILDLLGYKPEELKSLDYEEQKARIHPDDLPNLLSFSTDLIEADDKGEKYIEREFRLKSKQGNYLWVHGNYTLIREDDGNPRFIVGSLQDITERKQAEKTLRESEEKYRLLVENTDTGFVVVDESGVVVEANEPYCRLVGVTKIGEIIGRSVIDWTAPESKEENAAAVEQCAKQGYVQDFETTYIREDNQRVNILINAIMHETAEGKRLHALCRDITERKHLEKINSVLFHITTATNTTRDLRELLKTIRTYLHEVIDTTNFYIGLYDGSTDTITEPYSADDYDKYTSFPAGKTLTAYVIKTGQSLFADDNTTAELENEGKIEFIGTPSKLWLGVPLRVKDTVIGALVVQSYTDANQYTQKDLEILEYVSNEIAAAIERIRSEEELRQAEQKLRLHIDNTPLAVIEWDLGFKVASWNMAAQKIFGYTFEEAQGHHAAGLIVPESARAHVDQVWQELLEKKGGQRSVNENVTKAGDIIMCDWYNTPLVDENNNVIGVASLVLDLTDQKKLEDQLRHAQKMEAIGQLAGGVAHDFNNKLGGIIGFAELALGSLDDRVALADYLKKIIDRSDKSARLVRQLLAFSRQQILDLKKVDLNRIIMEASRFLTKVIGEHIDLQLELTGEQQIINADPNAIDQIITNLCINARDAMPSGGYLILKTENVVLDDDFCARSQWIIPGEYILFTIIDSGHGIPEDTIQHIFEPFYTTKGVGEGTGLGLSMVFGLIKQHNGYIDCKSEINKGTTFAIYFPIAADNNIAVDTVAEESLVFSGSEQILLAEDDEVLLDVIQTCLVDLGYTVLPARNGYDAFNIFKANSSKIDLVISDVIMPYTGGIELYQMVRAINPEVKFLFITGYTSEKSFSVLPSDAATGILNKPFKRLVLAEKIRELLN